MPKPHKIGLYLILEAKRQTPPHYEVPADYPPLQPVGTYVEKPSGSPKGTSIHSVIDGPVEDVYTTHFVATAEVDYPNGERHLTFEPEAQQIFELLEFGQHAQELAKALVGDALERVAEVVANESQASSLAWIADQRRKVARHQ